MKHFLVYMCMYVEGIVQNYVRCKEYIAALLSLLGQSVLE